MNSPMLYLDHAATTPVYPEVVEAMLPYFNEEFGNASSNAHAMGWMAKDAVENARKSVAALIGAEPHEIFFTSGATESVNWALKGWFKLFGGTSMLLTQPTEHSAVLSSAADLETLDAGVCRIPVNEEGIVLVRALPPIVQEEKNALMVFMSANNETGVLQPLNELSKLRSENQCWFFCDATQSIGKVEMNVKNLHCDLLAFSAHKMGGPKGVGVLYIGEKMREAGFSSFIHGGLQQGGLRAGTLNVPGIVGLGKACELVSKFDAEKIAALRDRIEDRFVQEAGARIIGKKAQRVPHISSVIFPRVNAEALLMKINHRLAVSSGAACNSVKVEPSHVLKAMGLTDEEAYATLRFSLGYNTTAELIDEAVDIVLKAL